MRLAALFVGRSDKTAAYFTQRATNMTDPETRRLAPPPGGNGAGGTVHATRALLLALAALFMHCIPAFADQRGGGKNYSHRC